MFGLNGLNTLADGLPGKFTQFFPDGGCKFLPLFLFFGWHADCKCVTHPSYVTHL